MSLDSPLCSFLVDPYAWNLFFFFFLCSQIFKVTPPALYMGFLMSATIQAALEIERWQPIVGRQGKTTWVGGSKHFKSSFHFTKMQDRPCFPVVVGQCKNMLTSCLRYFLSATDLSCTKIDQQYIRS